MSLLFPLVCLCFVSFMSDTDIVLALPAPLLCLSAEPFRPLVRTSGIIPCTVVLFYPYTRALSPLYT